SRGDRRLSRAPCARVAGGRRQPAPGGRGPHGNPHARPPPGHDPRTERRARYRPRVRGAHRVEPARPRVGAADAVAAAAARRRAARRVVGGDGSRIPSVMTAAAMRIDAHQHFWRYTMAEYGWIDDAMAALRRDFLPADLEREMARAGVDACVAVQARQTLEETRWLLALADAHPFIAGVVGWIDLQSPGARAQL